MSHTLDVLSTAQHGTVDGFRAGCHGSTVSCGAIVSCTDAFTRYQGDWGFRKRVDAGEHPADIVTAELAALEQIRAEDRAANRRAKAERARAASEAVAKKRRMAEPRLIDKITEQVRRLVAEGKTVREMAAELGVSDMTVTRARQALGIRFTPSKVDHAEVARLHADGLTDTAIARRLGVSNTTISTIRRTKLNLTPIPVQAARMTEQSPRADRIARLRALHAEGMTDNEMAEALGVSRSAVHQARTRQGLALNKQRVRAPYKPRTPKPEPVEEQLDRTDLHPEVKAARVEDIDPSTHGTARGYEAGCRGSGCPTAPSCTDAMLNAHRAARRGAGA